MYKTYKILLAAAFCGAAFGAMAQPSSNLETFTLPYDITVTPEQGLIDILGPNPKDDIGATPLGCQQIGVVFQTKVASNPDFAGKIAIYKDGKDTPEEEVGYNDYCISYDTQSWRAGSVMFKRKYTLPGIYRVVIPEGAWILNPEIDFVTEQPSMGSSSTLSPRLELAYEIFRCCDVFPQPGVVKDFSDLRLVFPGAKSISVNTSLMRLVVLGQDYDVDLGYTIDSEVMKLIPQSSVTAAGGYALSADAGAFKITYENGETYSSEKLYYKYDIDSRERPVLEPAEGSEVGGFLNIKLSIDPNNVTLMDNDRSNGGNGIYRVLENGVIDENPVCYTIPTRLNNYQINYAAADLSRVKYTEPFVPEDGEYVFVPDFFSFYDDNGVNPGGYNFRFTVKNGTVDPGLDPVVAEVKNMTELVSLRNDDAFKFEGEAVVSYYQDGAAFVQDDVRGALLHGVDVACDRGDVLTDFRGTCVYNSGIRFYNIESASIAKATPVVVEAVKLPDYTDIPSYINRLVYLKYVSVVNKNGAKTLAIPDPTDEYNDNYVGMSDLYGNKLSNVPTGYYPSIEGIFSYADDGNFVFYVTDRTLTAIDGIEAEEGAAEYYTLDGLRLQGEPQSGLYLRRQGGKVSKHMAR